MNDDRPCIIGQAPGSLTPAGCLPFSGRCGRRLEQLAALPPGELPTVFRLENLLPAFPGKAGKGDRFPLPAARVAAAKIAPTLPAVVIFAGRGVAAAFGFVRLPYLEWESGKLRRVAVIPHPSGVNQWWNEPSNVSTASRFIRTAIAQPR